MHTFIDYILTYLWILVLFSLTNQSEDRQHKAIINILNSNTYKGGKMIILGLLAGLILVDTATKKRNIR